MGIDGEWALDFVLCEILKFTPGFTLSQDLCTEVMPKRATGG
jgi:hypothetical protein